METGSLVYGEDRMQNRGLSISRKIVNYWSIFAPLLFTACICLIQVTPSYAISISQKILVGKNPTRLLIITARSEIYVSNRSDGTISIISTKTNKVIGKPIQVGGQPGTLVASPDGKNVYVGNHNGYVSMIRTKTRNVKKIVPKIMSSESTINFAVRDIAITKDGQKLYLAMEKKGLRKIITKDGSTSIVYPMVCPEAVAIDYVNKKLYVNYQCAESPGAYGRDAILVFDTETDERIESITHYTTGKHKGKRIPNVGSSLDISPDGLQVWANGADACSRKYDPIKDRGGYDFDTCPDLDSGEEFSGRGIINIIYTRTKEVVTKPFIGREGGSNIPLGAAVPTFFPDGNLVAVSTASRILLFNPRTRNEVDTDLPIPQAGNLTFTADGKTAYTPSSKENSVFVIQVVDAAPPAWLEGFTNWYTSQWAGSFWQTLTWHLTLVLIGWAMTSVAFARVFAHRPVLRLLLEIEIYLRGAKSRLVKLYLRQLKEDIVERHKQSGARSMVSLPIKRKKQRIYSDEWIKNIIKASELKGHYRAALIGKGGKGKTVLIGEAILRLIKQGHIPVLFQAVNYKKEASLSDWINNVLDAAQVPIRPSLFCSLPSLVYVIDQISEVRLDVQESFWQLIRSQFDPGVADVKLLISGRSLGGTQFPTVQKLSWDDLVEIDELDDNDIKELGAVYLDPEGQSEEIQELPSTMRAITAQPTAFVVSHYAKARVSSSRSISEPKDLYKEILDRHIGGNAPVIRPDIVKLVLQWLVQRHFGTTKNRGLPLDRHSLAEQVSEIYTEHRLVNIYGKSTVPKPAVIVNRLLESGLVYPTQTTYLFFHDSFEDWLLGEARQVSTTRI